MMAGEPGRKAKRVRFAVADLVVLIVGVALALAMPYPLDCYPSDLIRYWNKIPEWAGDSTNAERCYRVALIVAEVIPRACLAMTPLMLWSSARFGRTLRAAELLMVAVAAPLLVVPASHMEWLNYAPIDGAEDWVAGDKFYVRQFCELWRFNERRNGQGVCEHYYSRPAPRRNYRVSSGYGGIAPTPGQRRFLIGIEVVAVSSIAARLLLRRRLKPWMISTLLVTAVLTSTSWLVDPLTCLFDNLVQKYELNLSPWSEGAGRLVDAFGAVVPAILTISAIRDFARDRRGRAATEWLGLALASCVFVACETAQFRHTFDGGEFINEVGPAIPSDSRGVMLALFLVVPVLSCLVALLIHATLAPTWRRWTASGYDNRSENPITPEA